MVNGVVFHAAKDAGYRELPAEAVGRPPGPGKPENGEWTKSGTPNVPEHLRNTGKTKDTSG